MISVLVSAAMILLSGPVVRWSSDVPIQGEDIQFADRGVVVKPEGEIVPIVIPWYDLKSIPGGWTGDAMAFKDFPELARTARDRRMRGDPVAAGVLYQELNDKIDPDRGEQALDLAIGLMESSMRLHDGSAAQHWLHALRFGAQARTELGSGIDAQTGIHPEIIPIYRSGQKIPEIDLTILGERERILAGYFEIACGFDTDIDIEPKLDELAQRARKLGQRDAGIALVQEIVGSRFSEDPIERKAIRESLERKLRSGVSGWKEGWIRLAIGVSLLEEQEESNREMGVLECVAVIVSVHDAPPLVVQIASEFAVEYLQSTGRDEYARTIQMTASLMKDQEFSRP